MRTFARLMVLLGAPVWGSCQDYPFERVCSQQVTEENVTFDELKPKPADILFIVDNSGSMEEEQDNLAVNFDRFISEIAGTLDYRIAVVTTDQTNETEREGRAVLSFAAAGPYRERTEFDQSMCDSAGIPRGCFRSESAATRVIDSRAFDVDSQIEAFRSNVKVGTCGSGTEQGLAAMLDALAKTEPSPDDPNPCNATLPFIRDDANLVLIFVSDENDSSPEDIDVYVEELERFKPYEQIRVATIVGFADGQANDCRTGADGRPQSGCGVSVCSNPPPLNSQDPCQGEGQGTCALGEICFDTGAGRECRDDLWALWNNQDCSSCSVFNTDDCCLADSGSRYVDFVYALEQEIAAATSDIEVTRCTPEGEDRPACLLGSVCEESFGDTLIRIARDLVIQNEFPLDPPVEYPPGLRARLVGGEYGEDGRELEADVDFEVVENDQGQGVGLLLRDPDLIPVDPVKLQVFYVSELIGATDGGGSSCPPR